MIGYSDAEEKPAWLLLEYVPHGSPGGDYAERLGEALAILHEAGEGPVRLAPFQLHRLAPTSEHIHG